MAAGIRISQLPNITAMTNDDILIVNDGDTSTRKITYSNFKTSFITDTAPVTSVNTLTGAVVIDAASLSVYTKAEVDASLGGLATNALLGVTNGSADMGTFTGSAITPNASVKQALQDLETAIETGDAQDAILSGNNAFIGNNTFAGTTGLNGVVTAAQNGNIIPFYFDAQANFPSASTYHGAIAHSHADGKMFFAHGGGWVALANGSEVFSGAYGDLTGTPTLGTASAENVSYFATAAQGTLADSALQAASVGTAAAEDVGYFATAAQGTTADSAVQASAGAITITSLPVDGSATADQLAGAINTLTTQLAAILNS